MVDKLFGNKRDDVQ